MNSILEYPTLAALAKKDSGQDKMEQDEPDNDNVFEEATKSEVGVCFYKMKSKN